MAMDTPELKKNLDPTIWRHLPPDMRNKVLFTHVIDTFESPEYTPNINLHIRNMRTVCKAYRNFIQKPETMFDIFQQLKPVNKDIQNIFDLDPKFTFIKAVTTNNSPAINLSLIYNRVPNRLPLLLAHCDKQTLRTTMENITKYNTFRPEELGSALTQAHKQRNIDQIGALFLSNAPIEEISFIAELKPQYRTKTWIRSICHFIFNTGLKAYILLDIDSSIYNCKLPIVTGPLLSLSEGNAKITESLLSFGIDPRGIDHESVSFHTNIARGRNDCVAIFLKHIVPEAEDIDLAVRFQNTFALKSMLKANNNITSQELENHLRSTTHCSYLKGIKILLEYIPNQDIKLDIFNNIKQTVRNHRTLTIKIPKQLSKTLAVFCKHLDISQKKVMDEIDSEIKSGYNSK
jgi:hypothetical protein